jgi:hypothetical protein
MAAAGVAQQGQQQMILQAALAQQLASKVPVTSGLNNFSLNPTDIRSLQQQLQQHIQQQQQSIQNLQLLLQSAGQLGPNLQTLLLQNQVSKRRKVITWLFLNTFTFWLLT